jgi:2,5-diketo-D-gluconate reductase B
METRQLGDATIPVLGLDTYNLQGDALQQLVREALGLGYRYFDTAQVWQNEGDLGAALTASGVPRAELFIATRIAPDRAAPREVISSVKESLAALQTDYVDLLLLHAPRPNVPMRETLEAMCMVKAAGKARAIGVADFDPALLQEAVSYELDSPLLADAVEYHPYTENDTLRETALENGILLIAYEPLAGGAAAEDLALKEIGEAHGKSAAQVALRWLVQQEPLAALVPALNRDELAEYAAIFDFSLSDEEMARIAARSVEMERPVNPAARLAPDWGWPEREEEEPLRGRASESASS